jgi:hypothetical protein
MIVMMDSIEDCIYAEYLSKVLEVTLKKIISVSWRFLPLFPIL